MSDLSFIELENLWIQAGGDPGQASTAAAIALAESSGNPTDIFRGTPGRPEYSVGLWQINLLAHPQYNATDIQNPMANAKAAVQTYKDAGNSFTPWSTYTDGRYKSINVFSYGSGTGAQGGYGSTPPTSSTSGSTCTYKVSIAGSTICLDKAVGLLAMVGGSVVMLAGVLVIVAVAAKGTGIGKAAATATAPLAAVAKVPAQRREARTAREAAGRKDAVTTQREAQRAAIDRSRLRRSRALARVAEGKARAGKPKSVASVAKSARAKANAGQWSSFTTDEVQWANANPTAVREALKRGGNAN